jgi:predicted metal-binding membrane protein
MFWMWAVMMVRMMVPSAAPMALMHAAVTRKAAREGATLSPTLVFVAGCVLMWTLFSGAATPGQWARRGPVASALPGGTVVILGR